MTLEAGEKPGKGKYKCTNCAEVITLENASDALPECPACTQTEWKRQE
ncbi:MAG: hypothetical protein HXS41_13030 [Theionarchaea archaeon]|nr:hypothetical protein [Theionarchaea archaeon]MBU7000641.1 hypothetical protein [Theionarchaea archaeon]MBU7021976.1 hypothetical protein [Theionarchaea archaeon]MBU7035784.1 hypothetical protein [Theionarchaea archaeon]MBU7041372.1 hypothetical protein [Theionarchaea archaeon]